jgi:hypothetical protein
MIGMDALLFSILDGNKTGKSSRVQSNRKISDTIKQAIWQVATARASPFLNSILDPPPGLAINTSQQFNTRMRKQE